MGKFSLAGRVIYFSIKDPIATRSLVSHIIRSPSDSIILPYIDHPGPVSKEILSRDFSLLTVCERDENLRQKFYVSLKDAASLASLSLCMRKKLTLMLSKLNHSQSSINQSFVERKHPNKNVQVYPDDLFDLSYKTHSDSAQKRCAEIVKAADSSLDKSLICDRHVKLLVPLLKSKYEAGFLRNLYYQVCLRLGLCSNSLVHYYFLLSDRQHAYLRARPRENMRLYRSASVLYNTIFNLTTLESYNLEKCFGINVKKIQNTAANNIASYRKVHLVWFEPRLDVINTLSPRSLIEFRFLVTQMMHKRTGLAVKFLDRFFDDYRKDLSLIGIVDSTRSGDMSKEQYYKLFLYLKDRPDYKNSTFLQAVACAEENVLSLQD